MTFEITILLVSVSTQILAQLVLVRILSLTHWWVDKHVFPHFFLLLVDLHVKELLKENLLTWITILIFHVLQDLLLFLLELLYRDVLRDVKLFASWICFIFLI